MDRRNFLTLTAATTLMAPALIGRAQAEDDVVRMRELYNRDLSFSDYALARDGQNVRISGFMAPPLRAESVFFVLTKMPMAVCPFCSSATDWPADIVSVYSRDVVDIMPFNVPIEVGGVLKLGVYEDKELGFVSKVRLVEAQYRRV